MSCPFLIPLGLVIVTWACLRLWVWVHSDKWRQLTVALFTQAKVETLARTAGFTSNDAKIAAAIAMVESASSVGGVPYADSDKVGDVGLQTDYWGPSIGLWQIRSVKAEYGKGSTRDGKALLDPAFNARSAFAVFTAQGFRAWSVYTGGQYKAYLPDLYPPPPNTHVVQSGDTLGKIAQRYGTTVATLVELNGIKDPNKLSIGQHIKLPGSAPPPPPPYQPPPFPTGLKPGSASPSAKPLQRALKATGYMPASVAEADNYGPLTQDAVARFHNAHPQFRSAGVTRDVAIGPKGWAHLHQLAYGAGGA